MKDKHGMLIEDGDILRLKFEYPISACTVDALYKVYLNKYTGITLYVYDSLESLDWPVSLEISKEELHWYSDEFKLRILYSFDFVGGQLVTRISESTDIERVSKGN